MRLEFKINHGQTASVSTTNLKKEKETVGDGVKCVGDVNAAMRGGGLSIVNTGIANCSDGSFVSITECYRKPM